MMWIGEVGFVLSPHPRVPGVTQTDWNQAESIER